MFGFGKKNKEPERRRSDFPTTLDFLEYYYMKKLDDRKDKVLEVKLMNNHLFVYHNGMGVMVVEVNGGYVYMSTFIEFDGQIDSAVDDMVEKTWSNGNDPDWTYGHNISPFDRPALQFVYRKPESSLMTEFDVLKMDGDVYSSVMKQRLFLLTSGAPVYIDPSM